MKEHDPLNSVLREWEAPEPPSAVDARVRAAYRQAHRPSLWRRIWSARVTIPVPVLAAALLLIAAAIGWKVLYVEKEASLEILPIPDLEVGSRETLERTVAVRASAPRLQWRFSLEHAPPGAQIDAQTGRFVWKPAEHQSRTKYHLAVRIAAGNLSAQRSFRITVRPESPGKPADEKPVPEASKTQVVQDVAFHAALLEMLP